MTETIDTAQPEALRLASWLRDRQSHLGPSRFSLRDPEVRAEWDDYDKAAIALESLHSALAAAEARNATLTDDAARWQWLRDDGEGPTGTLCMARIDGDGDQILCEVSNYDEEADAAIQARAAASISTKGDGQHG